MGKKKMGRPTALQKHEEISIERIKKLYEYWGSCRAVGKILAIDTKTVSKYLKESGVNVGKPGWDWVNTNKLNYGSRGIKNSSLANWIKSHPTKKLPRSYAEISRITGIPYQTVYNYFKYHCDQSKEFVQKYLQPPFLKKKEIPLEAIRKDSGEIYKWNTKLINDYKINVDSFTAEIYIRGFIEDNEKIHVVSYRPYTMYELEDILKIDISEKP